MCKSCDDKTHTETAIPDGFVAACIHVANGQVKNFIVHSDCRVCDECLIKLQEDDKLVEDGVLTPEEAIAKESPYMGIMDIRTPDSYWVCKHVASGNAHKVLKSGSYRVCEPCQRKLKSNDDAVLKGKMTQAQLTIEENKMLSLMHISCYNGIYKGK